MSSNIIFLRFPAFPWRLRMFRPDPELAQCAAACRQAGQTATVLDFSTVEAWAKSFAPALPPLLSPHWHTLRHWPKWMPLALTRRYDRRLPAALTEGANAAGASAAEHALLRRHDTTAVVRVASQLEYAAALAFSKALEQRAPRTARILIAPETLTHSGGHFIVGGRELFHATYSKLEAYACTALDSRAAAVDTCAPEVYPALYTETQLKLFDICCEFEHIAPSKKALGWAPEIADTGKVSAIGSADWAAEAAALHGRFGVRTFYRRTTPAGGVPDWAGDLQPRIRRAGWQYGMTVDGQFKGEVWPRAYYAGCRLFAVSCRTGSQRLLEAARGSRARISRQAGVLQAAAEAGCPTHANFTYPVPADDYHSGEETLHFIKRTRPEGVSVQCPPQPHNYADQTWNEHFALLERIGELGISTAWTADEVLALHAGQAECGRDLAEETTWALAAGDGIALSATIEHMNRGLQTVQWGRAADIWRDAAGQG